MGIQAEDVGVVATTIQTGHCHTARTTQLGSV
jgi:hypothetical protein